MTDIIVPDLGESVSEATVSRWFKAPGEAVAADEPIAELETDKVTMEVNAPVGGALKSIAAEEGATVEVGAVIGKIAEGAAGSTSKKQDKPSPKASQNKEAGAKNPPAVSKMMAENNLSTSQVPPTGKDGRQTKADVVNFLESGGNTAGVTAHISSAAVREERVKMTKLRQVIAKRLKDSQNTAAILTTFNEVDMTNILQLRKTYKDSFQDKYGIKLGFMGFFVKAAVSALQQIPQVNAQIDGDELIFKNYYDVGVAVGTQNGLVVPVIRDCNIKSIAQIEADIAEKAKKAREGTLEMSELQGGTFTISNGGVYGSLMSTPIINPPQSGILGMHKTQERAMVVDGEIKARPMMYLALSYDHRIVDGKESVTFLVKVKEAIEDPRRLLLGV